MIYEYKCPRCSKRLTSRTRANRLDVACEDCGHAPFHRVFSVNFAHVMQEHFNNAVGKSISDMGKFRDELKRQSDIASERTGMEHRFVPVDMGDAAAVGADNKGIEESNRVRSKLGAPLLPEVK